MANSAAVRTGLNTLIAENWSNTVRDTLFDVMPLLALFFAKYGQKKAGETAGLGIPDAAMLMTGIKSARIKQQQIFSSLIYQPLIHNSLPSASDGKVMGRADSLPVRNNWQTNSPAKRFARPAFKWCEIADPCEVPNKDLRVTRRQAIQERKGWAPIGDLLNVERNDVLGVHLRRWNQFFWGTQVDPAFNTTGAPTDDTADEWDAPHSLKNALGTSNLYAGVDRSLSANAYWRGNYVSAATAPVFRELIRYANYGTPGLYKKGGKLDVMLCGGDLFSQALSEADAKGGIVTAGTGIAEFGQFGFKTDVVKIDNTFIIPDPECPAGHVAGLRLGTWTVAVHPDANFVQTPPKDQSEVKGGDDSHAWNLRTQLMMVCEVPSQNIYWDAVG